MQDDYLLPILLISPLITAGAIAFLFSQSLLSLLVVLVGAIAGAILIGISAICWLQVLHRQWMESQAAGFIFIPFTVPFCAYTGAVTGASLVAILYGHQESPLPSLMFQIIAIGLAIGLTVALSGLVPSTILAMDFLASANKGDNVIYPFNFFCYAIYSICGGVVSSWFASKLAYLLVASLCQYIIH